MKCRIHRIPLVCYCPACRGAIRTSRKAAASRRNGKLGGRPSGKKGNAKKENKGHDLQA
jgi:hypothetical protein